VKKRVLYGVANYEEIVRNHGYFVDKTEYIARLESINNPVFLRPRRFGKSLLCSMLRYYYDLNFADRFEELFGETWIGKNPTPFHNTFLLVSFDFSSVEISSKVEQIEYNFKQHCNFILDLLRISYPSLLSDFPAISLNDPVSVNLGKLLHFASIKNLPPIYVIIDEYDNFANQLIVAHKDGMYHEMMIENSFLKAFFKTLKEGRKIGAVANTFVTGVLPIAIDDLASGYNIAQFITLDRRFENMLGFTQDQVDRLLDEIFRDYALPVDERYKIGDIVHGYYNGYHFVNPAGKAVYNSTSLMFFLEKLCGLYEIPHRLIDINLKTDISWVRRLTASNPQHTEEFVDQLTLHNQILYDQVQLLEKFNMSQFFEKGFYPVSFFYLGMLTRDGDFTMRLPNVNMQQIFTEYFNEIHHIDVSTRYEAMMQGFVNRPDLPRLFANYWELYVSQLPEAIFQQVNENFYRTTFFELCSRYLSRWFTWNVERSYPQGRSDLEFVGKYHEKFAGRRMVIEFKYYSNAELKRLKTRIEDFGLQEKDTRQIAGYVEGLAQEYPEAQVSQFVIYCFGNQGFRVFEV